MSTMKILWLFGIVGFTCIAVATAWLAALNWSERLYMPMLTAIAVGLVSGFVTLAVTLKEVVTKDVFVTSLLVNPDGTAPIVLSEDLTVSSRLSGVGSLIAQQKHQLQHGSRTTDIFADALEVEQYYVARLMAEIQSGGWALSYSSGTVSAIFHAENPLKESSSLSLEQLSGLFGTNVFWTLPMEKTYWSFPRFKLPPGTEASLFHIPTSPESGPEKRGIRFQKRNFFQYEVLLEPVTATQGLPRGVTLIGTGQPLPTTVYITVRITTRFDRMTSGNHRTEEYKEWASWLNMQLKGRLSDEK